MEKMAGPVRKFLQNEKGIFNRYSFISLCRALLETEKIQEKI
jgi:hypothetical protein